VIRKTFSRKVNILHKDISANYGNAYDYIRDEMAENIAERMAFLSKKFPNILEIGAGKGHLMPKLLDAHAEFAQFTQNSGDQAVPLGIQNFYLTDGSEKLLHSRQDKKCKHILQEINFLDPFNVERIHMDDEDYEQYDKHFQDQSLDMVISSSYLHWINDHNTLFRTILRKLKPDGAFFGALIGGDTLFELRSAFVLAEQEREGGVSPHTSPFAGIRETGNQLSRAGFSLPTVDNDTITVYYPDAFTAMRHLQYMGDNNALMHRRPQISRETLLAAAAIYDELYYDEKHGGVPATFEIIYFVGWSPDPSQPKAKKRGSATVHMKDLAKTLNTELHVATEDDHDEKK
jgi:NADH dehydrogenase [ubiquinone] 1 alpha subcomplex assembly factor 5